MVGRELSKRNITVISNKEDTRRNRTDGHYMKVPIIIEKGKKKMKIEEEEEEEERKKECMIRIGLVLLKRWLLSKKDW
jgi:hypothetical protein